MEGILTAAVIVALITAVFATLRASMTYRIKSQTETDKHILEVNARLARRLGKMEARIDGLEERLSEALEDRERLLAQNAVLHGENKELLRLLHENEKKILALEARIEHLEHLKKSNGWHES